MRPVRFGQPVSFRLASRAGEPEVRVCYSVEEYCRHRQSLSPGCKPINCSAGRTSKFVFLSGRTVYLVGVFDGKKSTLVHELDHLVTMVLAAEGTDASTDDGEPHCYLLDQLCSMLGIDDTCREHILWPLRKIFSRLDWRRTHSR